MTNHSFRQTYLCNMPRIHDHENEITYFGKTNFRHGGQKFGIKTDDRRRHIYIVGKTGVGKTTLIENMVLQDIYNGHGVCYIDPHGDTVEKMIDYIPSWRINDVVYFNPADVDNPFGFNVLGDVSAKHKHLAAAGLMSVFKKIWENMWSARMEYILGNTILALLDTPGSTLLGINRMYSDEEYRMSVVKNIKDPVVKQFWVMEFAAYSEKYATEAVAAVQNKVGQFLSSDVIRNIVAQVKSTFNIRELMDSEKIFLVNLSKGRIGEDNMRLLGGMIINKIQISAMERVDMAEHTRRDYYLYVDEFQNFATEAFANILSEARKYRLNLTVAHQYMAQLAEEVKDAVLGNVGTMIVFRLGAPDAAEMETEFAPRFTPEDLINLPKFHIYLKLMIDGVATHPFSAHTLPPIARKTGSEEKVIRVSRERYAKTKEDVEERVGKWIGLDESVDLEEVIEKAKAKATGNPPKKKHKYKCSWTGEEFQIPVKLDRARPIYSEAGKELVREAKKDGSYDPRKDIIYNEELEPYGSVAELGSDGTWALRDEDNNIVGIKSKDDRKKEKKERLDGMKKDLGMEKEAPKASDGPSDNKPEVEATLDDLKKASDEQPAKKKRKRRRKKKSGESGGDLRGGRRSGDDRRDGDRRKEDRGGSDRRKSDDRRDPKEKKGSDDAPKKEDVSDKDVEKTKVKPGETVKFDE